MINNKHYKKTLKDGTPLESIEYLQGIMGDKFQYGCWFNELKYGSRMYDKHKTPIEDIKKIMHFCLFHLNDLHGNLATTHEEKLFEIFELIENKKTEAVKAREQLMADFVGLSINEN